MGMKHKILPLVLAIMALTLLLFAIPVLATQVNNTGYSGYGYGYSK